MGVDQDSFEADRLQKEKRKTFFLSKFWKKTDENYLQFAE